MLVLIHIVLFDGLRVEESDHFLVVLLIPYDLEVVNEAVDLGSMVLQNHSVVPGQLLRNPFQGVSMEVLWTKKLDSCDHDRVVEA